TEALDSNGVYRPQPEPLVVTTHPLPPLFLGLWAAAADASSEAIEIHASLEHTGAVHYAVFSAGQQGETDSSEMGCHNTSGTMGPAALNSTLGLVASGVVLAS
ncbi:unnamed protein product, partial [Choristocarpus tenellus]